MKKLFLFTVFTFCSQLHADDAPFGDSSYKTGFGGYLYDLKKDEKGEATEVAQGSGNSLTRFYEAFGDLIRKKFSERALDKYAVADEYNGLKYFYVKSIKAEEAPAQFGSSYIDPMQIIMVYKGIVEEAPKKEFRFAGVFDDAMCVLVNGKLVFYVSRHEDELRYKPAEVSKRRKDEGVNHMAYGNYIKLNKGDELTLVAAEVPGGGMSGKLLVQLKGYKYEDDKYEDPVLHPFVCAELTEEDEKLLGGSQSTLEDLPTFRFKLD
ncbi:hypothetical protein [Rubritalea sp.]|uniref:hypothetical protein n=1 Tax=Rubritalea sp. TaxID=2109375 RepID=UPI003EF0E0D2